MRNLLTIALATGLVLFTSQIFAADTSKAPDVIHVAALDQSCVDRCETQKEQCFAQYTQSDSTHGNYITPDGHKICWQAYHECKKSCER